MICSDAGHPAGIDKWLSLKKIIIMLFKRKASDFMTSNVIVGGKENNFKQFVDFFTIYKIQHLPIVDNDKLIGILSVNDMLKFVAAICNEGKSMSIDDLNKAFHIEKVMTPNPITVERNDSQKKVLEILGEGKFQAVPVVEDNQVIGIITNKDIARVYQYDLTHVL
jgi:CBS domain-containing protein